MVEEPALEEQTVAELKTQLTKDDARVFLAAIPDEGRRADARIVCDLLARVTGEPAEMWGKGIVGFGRRRLRYDSGRELDWMEIGFSPRKANTTIYLSGGLDHYADLMGRLGKHTTGGGCLYLRRVGDVDAAVLEELLTRSVAHRVAGPDHLKLAIDADYVACETIPSISAAGRSWKPPDRLTSPSRGYVHQADQERIVAT